MLDYWSVGLLECWIKSVGLEVLDYWSVGL